MLEEKNVAFVMAHKLCAAHVILNSATIEQRVK